MKNIMEIVKKNLVSIICGVIAVAAVVAIFYPLAGKYKDLQTQVNSRVSVYNSLKSLDPKDRKLPSISLNGDPKPLTQFPNIKIIEAGKTQSDKLHTDADAVFKTAVKLNTHEPLVPNALPQGQPFDTINFRRVYTTIFDPAQPQTLANSPIKIMNAGLAPTEQDIENAKQAKTTEIQAKANGGGPNADYNNQQVQAELDMVIPQVGNELKMAAAKKYAVYLDPNAFEKDPVVSGVPGQPIVPIETSNVFVAQYQVWVAQDVAAAIAAINKDAKTTLTSTVKHLVHLSVDPNHTLNTLLMQQSQTPPAANADPTAAITPNYSLSPSGRTVNGLYDVVQFRLTINVDATQVSRVLQELSRNRFITVTACNVVSIDSAQSDALGYKYGSSPVVQLNMQCEDLFFRQWTTPLMPLRIKQALGIVPPAQPVQQ